MKRRAWLSVLLSVCLLLIGGRSAHAASPPPVPAPPTKAAIVELSGEIDDFNRDQFIRRFNAARESGASVIIVNLDTYGGLVTSGLEISRFIKRQSDVHTIAFVQDKAISAGAMIAMACDEIVMSHAATLGDCAPIVFGPDNSLENMSPAERAKAESPVLEDFTESAIRNHHDLLLAKAMVSVQVTVYWIENARGQRQFVTHDQYLPLVAAGWHDVPGAPVPVDSDTTLLTVSSEQAVAYGLASGLAESAASLASQNAYTVVAEYHSTQGDKLVELLGTWPVRLLLIVVFLSCANIVLHAPGHGVAEVIGLAALLLMLGVPLLTGYAQWWEIALVFVGLTLIAVEILLPGHLVPAIVGSLLVGSGLVLTFAPVSHGTPVMLPSFWHGLQRGLMVVAGALGSTLVIWYWLNRFLPRTAIFNRLVLTATSGGPIGAHSGDALLPSPASASWPVVGSVGQAFSELKPGGTAVFFDESTREHRTAAVVSDSGFVSPGAQVVVQHRSGSRIVVRSVSVANPAPPLNVSLARGRFLQEKSSGETQ